MRLKMKSVLMAATGLTVVSGVIAAGVAMAASDVDLPHEPAALQAQMVSEVGSQFAAFGPPAFVPLDQDLKVVSSARYARSDAEAASAYLLYGQDDHSVKVFVGPNADPSGAGVENACDTGAQAFALSCSAEADESGGLVVTSVYAFERSDELGGERMVIGVDALRSVDVATVEFERNVRHLAADGSMTSVTETLRAPTSKDFGSQFTASTSDMHSVATDPGLSWQ